FLRSSLYDFIEGAVVGGTAIGISGAVLLDGADVDLLRSQHLCPTHGRGKKMSVAKWHVCHRNAAADLAGCIGHRNFFIGQRRTTNLAERLVAKQESIGDFKPVADCLERLSLPCFRALSIAHMQGRRIMITDCQSCANTGIHSTAQHDYGPARKTITRKIGHSLDLSQSDEMLGRMAAPSTRF